MPRSWAQLEEAGIAEAAALRRRITGCVHRSGVDAPAESVAIALLADDLEAGLPIVFAGVHSGVGLGPSGDRSSHRERCPTAFRKKTQAPRRVKMRAWTRRRLDDGILGPCRYRARTLPTIVVVVGSLTWGCTAPSGADQPVSAPPSPSFVTTASTPGATRRPTVHYDATQRQLQRELNGATAISILTGRSWSASRARRPWPIYTSGSRRSMRMCGRSRKA